MSRAGGAPASTGRGRRVAAMVCTGMGLAAMIVAPRARSESPSSPVAARPTATATAALLASVGEQPAARARAPEEPGWVEGPAGKAFVYPPRSQDDGAQPVTVILHGMCGHPQSACAPFVDVATTRGWLVCPRGEDECGGGTRWRLNGPDDARLVEESVHAVASRHDGRVDDVRPRVLVGFSLGGTAAVQIAQASVGRYAGLVVIASQVHPDAAALRKAGVKRVVLAAGDLDMTSAPLRTDARALEAQGLPTRFVSLGPYGHGYPPDMEQRMREPMQWAGGS